MAEYRGIDIGDTLKQYKEQFLKLLPSSCSSDKVINVYISLSADDYTTLKKYIQNDDQTEIITSIIRQVDATHPVTKIAIPWTALTQTALSIGAMCLCIHILIRIKPSIIQLGMYTFLLTFLISIPWNWWRLYQMEKAAHHTTVARGVPLKCDIHYKKSFVEILQDVFSFSKEDECVKYHQQLMTDPIWEVAPTKAIVATITRLILEPAEHVGEAISKFIRASLHNLPVYLWPVVLILISIVFVMTVVFFRLFGPLVAHVYSPGSIAPYLKYYNT